MDEHCDDRLRHRKRLAKVGPTGTLRPTGMTGSDKPAIRLLHHLARTGGTVISKCLGCMSGVVLLSEIHPQGMRFGAMNPLRQACDWFGLVSPAEVERGGAAPFAEMVTLVHERCEQRGQRLVLRDWSHLDFLGVPFVTRPGYRVGSPGTELEFAL